MARCFTTENCWARLRNIPIRWAVGGILFLKAFPERWRCISFGINRDGDFHYDTTSVDATITRPPTPCAVCSQYGDRLPLETAYVSRASFKTGLYQGTALAVPPTGSTASPASAPEQSRLLQGLKPYPWLHFIRHD